MGKLAGDKQIPETGELFSTIGLHFVYQLYVQLDRTVDGHIGTPGVRALRRVEEAPRRDGDRVPNPDHQVAGTTAADQATVIRAVIQNNAQVDLVCIILYENIDQILPNKLHGPMHYKIGDACIYNGHLFYTLL